MLASFLLGFCLGLIILPPRHDPAIRGKERREGRPDPARPVTPPPPKPRF